MEPSRRMFLASSSALVLGANDRIRIGVIGTGGRGQYLMKELQKLGGVDFVAVSDVWDQRRDEAEKLAGVPLKKYLDHRDVLNHKDIDAVIVSTPDHWHASIAVDACKAGKDVYIEKPMVHRPEDGQAVVRAARDSKRVVTVGTQARALPHFVEAKQKYIDSGVMGQVGLVRTWYNSNRGYIQTAPAGFEKKPEGLDWERWCGPAKHVAWNPDIYFSPYKWKNYCGGMIMGIGIHVLDSARHLLNLQYPASAVASGGIFHYDDGRDTPDVVTLALEFPGKADVTFEAEVLTAPGGKTSAGVDIRGMGGSLKVERYLADNGYVYTPNAKFSKMPPASAPGSGASASYLLKDWLESMRTRKTTACTVEDGYYSAMACHLGMLAYEKKERVSWNPKWNLPA
jgi:predicted dehydrogenase